MRHALSSLVAAAVGEHLFNPVEVRPAGEGAAWRTVQGHHKRGAAVQEFPGFAGSRAVIAADEVHLLAADFTEALSPAGRPTTDWWVRFTDDAGAVTVQRLAEPSRVIDTAGRFIGAPLKPNQDTAPA